MASIKKCCECEMEHDNLYESKCCECYTNDYTESITSVYTPNYKLYRIGFSPNRSYCAYKVYFDKDGEQTLIELIDYNDDVVKCIRDDVLMVGEYDRVILEKDVPDIFRDNFTVICDWKE